MKHSFLKFALALSCASSLLGSQTFAAAEADADHDHEVEEFMKARTEQAEYFQKMQEAILSGRPVEAASGSCKYVSSIFQPAFSKVVTLTFDDGPAANLTPHLLDVLRKYGVKATFFVLGANAQANLGIIQRAQKEGHLIASHSWNHPNFHTLSQAAQEQQISNTDQVIHAYATPNKFFRYPYGNSTCSTNEFVKSLGYKGIVGWHVDTCDWAFAGKGYVTDQQAQICEVSAANKANYVGHVMSEINRHNGGVVLMHDVHAQTVQSVEEIIVRLKQAGYSFANLDDPQMMKFVVQ